MSRRFAIALAFALLFVACKEPYRVGDFVWVEWDERDYPAYIMEIRENPKRFRVHFDGYDERWDQFVELDRIKGRIEGEVTNPPPPPDRVARAMGAPPKASASAAPPVSPYRQGDRVRVRWRGSVYSATVIEVVGPDRVKVHYDGHEDAFDEVVDAERVIGRR